MHGTDDVFTAQSVGPSTYKVIEYNNDGLKGKVAGNCEEGNELSSSIKCVESTAG
jgi:hypothetical protein